MKKASLSSYTESHKSIFFKKRQIFKKKNEHHVSSLEPLVSKDDGESELFSKC